jgi:sarcosine oxidase subunit alpha
MPERVAILVDGERLLTEAGVTLAAALWNAGRWGLRRSPAGETRGALCGMGTCFECRVSVDGEPHRRACLEPVRAGMQVITRG